MKTDTMRLVDRLVGVPLCALLTLVRYVTAPLRRRRRDRPPEVRTALVVKFAEQGATVLAWPALDHLARRLGRENLYVVVFEPNRFILDVLDVCPRENVLTVPTKGFWGTLRGAWRALARARQIGVDAVFDFEFFARASAAFAYLTGAPVRVGLDSKASGGPWRGDLMTHRLCYTPHQHVSRTFRAMVRAIEVPAERLPALPVELPAAPWTPPRFRPSEAAEGRARAILAEAAGEAAKGGPLVLLNANASDLLPLRRWPAGRYAALARQLLAARPRVRIAFTGTPEQAPAAERLAAAAGSPRAFSVAGKTTLEDLLTLYTLADVLVTNDSGPGQFAALTPVRAVVLFGPETPGLFGPVSPRARVIWKGIACSPCVSAYNNRHSICRDNVCMQAISVEEVAALVLALLDEDETAGDPVTG